MRAGSPETGGRPTSCPESRHGRPDPRTWSRHLSCHRAQQLDLAGRRASARGSEAEAARIGAGDSAALLALVTSLRAHVQAGLGAAVEVASCFEAGRDGFWLHRLLMAHGIASHVLEPTSILLVNRRARRAKTRPARRPRPAARADGLSRGRPAGLQHGAGADARGGGRQAPAPRARASGAGEGSPREPDRGVVGDPRHPAETLAAFMGTRPRPRSVPVVGTSCRRISGQNSDGLRRRLVLAIEMIREIEAERAAALAADPHAAPA